MPKVEVGGRGSGQGGSPGARREFAGMMGILYILILMVVISLYVYPTSELGT